MTIPQPPYVAALNGATTQPPAGYSAPPLHPAHRRLSVTAFALAIATVVLSLAIFVAQLLAIARFQVNIPLATAVTNVSSIVISFLAVAALVLGIIAARGARPVMAGIAIGISCAHLASQAMSLVATALMT